MRLSRRFLFVHTQKHTQEYSLDFRSSTTHHHCWLLAVHGPTAFWTLLLEASHTPPLVDFSQRTPHRTPTPQNPFGSHPATFTPCSARATTMFLKTPPSLFRVPVIFYFYFYRTLLELFGPDATVTIRPKVACDLVNSSSSKLKFRASQSNL